MAQIISQKIAQQIVDTVKDVCGFDINFIQPDGTILASTNAERIGTYHEIGYQAAQNGQMLEVEADNAFYGTQKGVNLPFSYQGEIVAVIGITGTPSETRKFAYLAQRITKLILRERDLDNRAHTEKEQIAYIVHSLITGNHVSHSFLLDFLKKNHMNPDDRYRTIVVQLENRYNPANLSLIEGKIVRVFEQTESALHIFDYPNRYILIESEQSFQKWAFQLKKLASAYRSILRIGIGSNHRLDHQNHSYQEARIAVSAADENSYAEYDQLRLEILLGSLSEESKERFCQKTIQSLDAKEQQLLGTYFSSQCHLKEAADKMYIHVNTLQYQLDRIRDKTGLNPRRFEDSVLLYLGLSLHSPETA